ncbi:hypothetical protein KKF61_09135 [Patescibacteria group bacterium]|nr:hypothetical protein [Patescibacteria group bacterium]
MPKMTKEEHIERHKELHKKLGELVADWLGGEPEHFLEDLTVLDLLDWSKQQTVEPENDGTYDWAGSSDDEAESD